MFRVEKGVGVPQLLHNFVPGQQLSHVLHQQEEQIHRDSLKPDDAAVAPEFVALPVQFNLRRCTDAIPQDPSVSNRCRSAYLDTKFTSWKSFWTATTSLFWGSSIFI